MNNILLVCVGNICRSPVAEGIFKAALPESVVSSAGLGALIGSPADPMAVSIALEHGLDISAHRAQQINSWMVSQADLILVMEKSHQKQLEQQYPAARGKVRRIGDFGTDGGFDVADPYKRSRTAFEASHHAIASGAAEWLKRIRQLT